MPVNTLPAESDVIAKQPAAALEFVSVVERAVVAPVNINGFTNVAGTQIAQVTVPEDGVYLVTAMVSWTGGIGSNAARQTYRMFADLDNANVGADGAPFGLWSQGNYIRDASGQNEGGENYVDEVRANTGQIVRLKLVRVSGSGGTTTIDNGYLRIRKIAA